MRLRAYLASALTNLGGNREEILSLQERVEKVCHVHFVDLYRPVKHTDPVKHPNVTPNLVFITDRQQVLDSDFLILLAHVPSFGGGQEVQLASGALMPILIIRPVGGSVSRMLLGIPTIKYEVEAEDTSFDERLAEALDLIRPIAGSRKEFISRMNKLDIGYRIRILREEAGLTQEELGEQIGVAETEIESIEGGPSSVANLSLIMIRKIADVLGVSPAEICDPLFVDAASSEIVKQLAHGVPLSALEYRDSRRGNYWRTVAPQDALAVLRRILIHVLERELR